MLHWMLLACARSAAPLPAGVTELDTQGHAGLSGLAVGPDAQLWAVTERPAALLRLDRSASAVVASWPITGLPDGVEPESVAVAASGALWIGTEGQVPGRPNDGVYQLQLEPTRAVATARDGVPWSAWSLRAEANRGLEGLCSAGETLLAVGEPTESGPGGRRAPLALRTAEGWRPHWLALHTKTGKAAGLWCTPTPTGGVRVAMLERHYGVLTLHEAHLSADAAAGSTLSSSSALPLPAALAALGANFEGLARVGSGWLLLSDNQTHRVTGPTYFATLPALPGD